MKHFILLALTLSSAFLQAQDIMIDVKEEYPSRLSKEWLDLLYGFPQILAPEKSCFGDRAAENRDYWNLVEALLQTLSEEHSKEGIEPLFPEILSADVKNLIIQYLDLSQHEWQQAVLEELPNPRDLDRSYYSPLGTPYLYNFRVQNAALLYVAKEQAAGREILHEDLLSIIEALKKYFENAYYKNKLHLIAQAHQQKNWPEFEGLILQALSEQLPYFIRHVRVNGLNYLEKAEFLSRSRVLRLAHLKNPAAGRQELELNKALRSQTRQKKALAAGLIASWVICTGFLIDLEKQDKLSVSTTTVASFMAAALIGTCYYGMLKTVFLRCRKNSIKNL